MDARVVWIIAFVLAGCGGGGSGGSPQMPPRFMYVSADQGPNEFYTEIFAFTVASGGALQPVTGFAPVPSSLAGGGPLAITRDSKLLYTTDTDQGGGLYAIADQIKAFQINPDASLTPALSPTLSMTDGPVDLVVHPTADLLYVSSVSGVLSVFAINSATGALALKSSVSLGSNIQVQSAVITPNGKYVYQAYVDYPNGFTQRPALPQLAGFSIDATTGGLSAVAGSPVSISTDLSIGTMSIDPTGKFLYATYEDHNEVAAFLIDATSGTLTAVSGSPFTVGGSEILTTIAVDASGKFLIVGLEPGAVGKCLDVLSIDSGTGALTPVPGSPFGPATLFCPEVVADPSQPLVYAGTGVVTPPATVVALSVDPTTGALTSAGEASVPATTLVNVDVIAMTH
jgi:6-phosphogluconolactonase (cycloisomerase 2 family)